jgi:hypothetical protein
MALRQIARPRHLPSLAAIVVAASRWERDAALILTAAVFGAIQNATPDIIGIDGYYHVKVAGLMGQHGPRLDFPWLQLTILGPGRYSDHHYLFHLLQVPFAVWDLRAGAKVAAVLFATLGLYTAYAFMARNGVRYPLLWLGLLLACSPMFLWRQSMARPQGLSLTLLVAALWVLFRGRPRLLVPLGFLAAWLFDGFVLVVALPAAALAARAALPILARLRGAGERPRPSLAGALAAPAWALLGVALGMLAHPYFPNNVEFAYLHLLPKAVVGDEADVRVGGEWYPFSPTAFAREAGAATALALVGLVPPILALRRGHLPNWRTLTLALLALGFLAMVIRSRRLIEYFPAFAVLFGAWSWSHTPLGPPDRVVALAGRAPRAVRRLAGWWPWLAGALLAPALVWTLMEARRDAGTGRPWRAYREPATWLAANTPAGARVFTTDWDDFPHLFFWNSHNVYLVGLDPTYMSLYDRELYQLWRRVSAGQVAAPSSTIRDAFGAEYVFTDLRHGNFLRAARDDSGLEEVLRTSNGVVFRVRGAAR